MSLAQLGDFSRKKSELAVKPYLICQGELKAELESWESGKRRKHTGSLGFTFVVLVEKQFSYVQV